MRVSGTRWGYPNNAVNAYFQYCSAGFLYTAGIVGEHTPALYRNHQRTVVRAVPRRVPEVLLFPLASQHPLSFKRSPWTSHWTSPLRSPPPFSLPSSPVLPSPLLSFRLLSPLLQSPFSSPRFLVLHPRNSESIGCRRCWCWCFTSWAYVRVVPRKSRPPSSHVVHTSGRPEKSTTAPPPLPCAESRCATASALIYAVVFICAALLNTPQNASISGLAASTKESTTLGKEQRCLPRSKCGRPESSTPTSPPLLCAECQCDGVFSTICRGAGRGTSQNV